jgi:hypothetical protein
MACFLVVISLQGIGALYATLCCEFAATRQIFLKRCIKFDWRFDATFAGHGKYFFLIL